jgi:hypothetical protein
MSFIYVCVCVSLQRYVYAHVSVYVSIEIFIKIGCRLTVYYLQLLTDLTTNVGRVLLFRW